MDKSTVSMGSPNNRPKEFRYGDKIINKKYTILYKIADEPHSQVYSLSTTKNANEIVRAIKIIGFPRLYEFGSVDNQSYMITKMLGPNLAQLHKLCNNRFSQATCLLVGLQILDRLQKIHELGYIYRDIRLDNFCIGLGTESSFIYMVDFGHCEKFRNKQNGSHVSYKEGNSNIEDSMFLSINVHNNVHYARRDDIESLLYLIIHMFKAKLPWRKVEAKTKKEKDQKIAQLKKAVSPSYLAKDFGIEMTDLLWYIRSVNFYQKPDYDFIRTKLYAMVMAKTESNTIEIKYDWNEREEMDFTIYTGDPKLFLRKGQVEKKEQKQQQDIDQMLKTYKEEQQLLI